MSAEIIQGKYTVQLISRDSKDSDLREVLYGHENLALACALYEGVCQTVFRACDSPLWGDARAGTQ